MSTQSCPARAADETGTASSPARHQHKNPAGNADPLDRGIQEERAAVGVWKHFRRVRVRVWEVLQEFPQALKATRVQPAETPAAPCQPALESLGWKSASIPQPCHVHLQTMSPSATCTLSPDPSTQNSSVGLGQSWTCLVCTS